MNLQDDSSLTEAVVSMAATSGNDAESDDLNYSGTLVGEGQKYADTEALAKAYSHASLHIKELQDKLDSRQQSDAAITEVLDYVRTNNTSQDNHDEPDDNAASRQVSPESVDVPAAVEEVLAKREANATAKANSDKAIKMLTDKYSVKEIQDTIRAMIAENPAQKGNIDTLGRTAPNDLVTLIESRITPLGATTNSPGDSGRSGGQVATNNYEYTYSQAKKLRKDNVREYNSIAHRAKMADMAAKYGEKWFQT